jgi:hypothetical protein
MPTLATELRNKLERVVIEARDAAEAGARAALEAVAVHHHETYPHMNPAQRSLRNHLRARARQLGDRQDASGRLAIDHLAGECAYEHWHRMLFARFLAENGLLIEPQENMAISLAEAEELAKEDGVDVWVFASRCAQRMLPQIFRPDDPLLAVSFATEHRIKLEKLLNSLPQAVFTASDALGWVYQFWQSKKKDEVNRSEVKIGADEISAVTQLFTEPYMVEFLLHNTLGAWWAGKKLAAKDAEDAETEAELRKKLSLPGVNWEYLRFVRGDDGENGPWRPAAGIFDGWPKTAAELKALDPCCGSGHFLVSALHHLVPIRMAEEGSSAAEAVDAVLRDNLHGLEIDERCCQIAAFALAFEAWKMTGYRELPGVHIACTGIGPQATEEQWLKLAEQSGIPMPTIGREAIKNGLLNLHRLFSQAPTLGSLINPAELPADLIAADYETIQPYLAAILKAEKADDETRERAIAAAGMVKAADLLAGEYTLVITNVPYLGLRKMAAPLKAFCERDYRDARHDLANVMLDRLTRLTAIGGSMSLVTPQAWFFAGSFSVFRNRWLMKYTWDSVARLGPGAFDGISGEVVNVGLLVVTNAAPSADTTFTGIDCEESRGAAGKSEGLRKLEFRVVSQREQLNHPDQRVLLSKQAKIPLLNEIAVSLAGIQNGDSPMYQRKVWEISLPSKRWVMQHTVAEKTDHFSGFDTVLDFDREAGHLRAPAEWRREALHDSDQRGKPVWGRLGLLVSRMSSLPCALYLGDPFDQASAVIVPHDEAHVSAVWAFCSSPEFATAVRRIDKKLNVTSATLAKVPFDLAHWQEVAAKEYPDGLPEPESDDPTQWLFHGRPEESTAPLQVAVVRLLGYRWPAELDEKMRLSKRARALVKRCDELAKFADDDGIVCIPSVRGEEPAAGRLLALLSAAGITPAKVRELTGGADLDDWLRNSFFEEHCKLFHDRPFVWHIWDGRKRDGFHALVNYHKLCEGKGKGRKLLESLTYAYLGEWITRQKDGLKRGEGGAEDRLAAALELQKRLIAILEGEPPFDLFVRWKPLAQQPIGWEPDINDGVRLNIRPFLASDLPAGRTGAGVLRWKPNVKWTKDRGKEPQRPKAEFPWFWGWENASEDEKSGRKPFEGGKTFDGNRHNDCHYTNKTKQAAREAAKGAKRG